MNATSPTMHHEWANAILNARDDDNVKVVIVTGAGRAFCAGRNLKTSSQEEQSQVGEPTINRTVGEHDVAEILQRIKQYHQDYVLGMTIPGLHEQFDLELFNTFRSYLPIDQINPVILQKYEDSRGNFVELMHHRSSGKFSFSTTKSGITRGNHFHRRKVERFMILAGEALIQLRRMDENQIYEFQLKGENPAYVDMPIWYTHNITNTGQENLITAFWCNEIFNPDDPDTFFLEV